MALLKQPFLSMDATGSVGQSITAQKRGHQTVLREKPFPSYRQTLPQLYQRWLYEDYAYFWTTRSDVTKRYYAAGGSRCHLTGFQYWMKVQLSTLPDIVFIYHLDSFNGGVLVDSSRNARTGTIYGATPTTLAINGALSFDGNNDYCLVPAFSSTLPILSFECFMNPVAEVSHATASHIVCTKAPSWEKGLLLIYNVSPNRVMSCFHDGVNPSTAAFTFPAYNTIYHVVGQFVNNRSVLYVNGSFKNQGIVIGTPLPYTANPLRIGGGVVNRYSKVTIDHLVGRNRILDTTEILRHSERRYTPQ